MAQWRINREGKKLHLSYKNMMTGEIYHCGTAEEKKSSVNDLVLWVIQDGDYNPGDMIFTPEGHVLYIHRFNRAIKV